MSTPSPKLDALAGMIERDGADPKPTMLRVLTDFYLQKTLHTPEEDRHFTELALRLIGDVNADTRADIARRLARHGNAPAIVLRRLAEMDVAAGDTFRFNAEPVKAAEPSPTANSEPTASAETPSVNASDRAAATSFTEQFFASDSADRRDMLRQLERGTVKLTGIGADAAMAACRELEGAALRSRPFEFVREMERALGIPRAIAQKIVNDASGESMLVVAKALGMPIEVVQRILLLVNPAVGTSVRRVFDLSELYKAMSDQSALRMIALWRYAAETSSFVAPARDSGLRRTSNEASRQQTTPATGEPVKRDQRAS
jgi:hypothetical protein